MTEEKKVPMEEPDLSLWAFFMIREIQRKVKEDMKKDGLEPGEPRHA